MTDAEYFNDIAHCMRLGDGKGAINVIARIRAEARAELVNKIQPIVERMDCTFDCESGDSDHSYEICECDKCELFAILADEPKEAGR